MIIPIIVCIICLILFVLVAIKQAATLNEHENGAKELRKKLLGVTIGLIIASIGSIVYFMRLSIFPVSHMITLYTTGIFIVAITWFYIYFVRA